MVASGAECWKFARVLYVRWIGAHGLQFREEMWTSNDEWTRGYWYSMAEFVLENF